MTHLAIAIGLAITVGYAGTVLRKHFTQSQNPVAQQIVE